MDLAVALGLKVLETTQRDRKLDQPHAPFTAMTEASLPFTLPAMPGLYEFRFFANDGYQLITTSTVVRSGQPGEARCLAGWVAKLLSSTSTRHLDKGKPTVVRR